MRRPLPRALAALTATCALVLLSAPAVLAHGSPDQHRQELLAGADQAIGEDTVQASSNVDHLANVPGQLGISGCFMPTAPLFVTSGLDTVRVFDVSRPRDPQLVGVLDNAVFENEAMNCGERRVDGKVHRFALIGVDLHQASSDDPDHTNLGDGQELMVVDVTDPANPRIQSRAPATTSTHTLTCIDDRQCRTVYSAGSNGKFSVFDLDRLGKPEQVGTVRSPAIGWGGHNWDVDGADYGLHTGAGGTAIFDVSKPRAPRLATTTASRYMSGAEGNDGYNNFIHHNSWRPNARAFEPGASPSLRNGNVLLVTEEDYEDVNCATAGSFQTWRVGRLGGTKPAITPLDKVELADLGNFPSPVGAFCSAHWFDYHPRGFVAAGFYGGGTQVIDVTKPRDIRSHGYSNWFASEVWDSYWVPRYAPNGTQQGITNVLYSVDLVRGLDVYAVDLSRDGGASAAAAGSGADVSTSAVAAAVVALPVAVLLRRRNQRTD